jgi:hypothetical protein
MDMVGINFHNWSLDVKIHQKKRYKHLQIEILKKDFKHLTIISFKCFESKLKAYFLVIV